MSIDMEDVLRNTLTEQSRGVSAPPDPWSRFEGREKVHRRNRRLTVASALSMVVIAAALVQTGTVSLPERNTNATVKFASSSPLLKAPVRGSLASDENWQRELLESIKSVQVMVVPSSEPSELPVPPEPPVPPTATPQALEPSAPSVDESAVEPSTSVSTGAPIPVESGAAEAVTSIRGYASEASMPGTVTLAVTPETMRVLYAGDVSSKRRLAAVGASGRHEGRDVSVIAWFEGSAGAAPDQMKQSEEPPFEIQGEHDTVVFSPMRGGNGEFKADVTEVVVLTSPDAVVEVAGPVHYLPEGRVDHPWTALPNRDGAVLVDARRRGTDGELVTTLRVTMNGQSMMSIGLNESRYVNDVENLDGVELAIIKAATVDTRGGPINFNLLRNFLSMARSEAQLPSWDGVEAKVLWYDTFQGQDTAAFTLQPQGGGVLAFAVRGKAEGTDGWSSGNLFRMLLPAAGADQRPFAWRVHASEPSEGSDLNKVKVIAPAGAASIEVVTSGKRTKVSLNTDGSADATVPADADGVVRALDAAGNVLGEMPVRPVDWNGNDVYAGGFGTFPGETAQTRVVP